MADPQLGTILHYSRRRQTTTVFLCHGPVALLLATSGPLAFQEAIRGSDTAKAMA